MSDRIEYFHAAPGSIEQNACIPMLAVCFDEFVQLRKMYGDIMPFTEESFVARCSNGRIAGHAGIMPITVYGNEGKILKLAGIASVAVHPDFRRRGIAAQLCENAAAWAEENGFDALPLYTGFNRVYESCCWQNYMTGSVLLTNPCVKEIRGKSGRELSASEKEMIISCYENGAVFPGKTIRSKDQLFHGWARMFDTQEFTWHVGDAGYALEWENTIAEMAGQGNWADLCGGIKMAFLSPWDPCVEKLVSAGWQVTAQNDNSPVFWHGENAMLRCCKKKTVPEKLFFSLADKF